MSASHSAGRLTRIIYAVAAFALPRLLRRMLLHGDRHSLPERFARVGRRVNAVARLQRCRPFPGVRFTRESGTDIPIEVVSRTDAATSFSDAIKQGVILYFHGGGFVTGGLDSHLHVVAALARRTRLPVVHVDYRQFPDVSVGDSVADCEGAYRWLLQRGADPAKTVLAGDSAGGFLAFATALAVQEHGLPAPAGVIGISALLELDGTARSTHRNLHRDGFGIPLVLADVVEAACPSPALRRELTPINGRLEKMPPALLIAGESEILRCDAQRLYEALQQAGRWCDLEVWDSQLHAFPALLPFLPESRAAFGLMARFVRQCLADAHAADEPRRDVS